MSENEGNRKNGKAGNRMLVGALTILFVMVNQLPRCPFQQLSKKGKEPLIAYTRDLVC